MKALEIRKKQMAAQQATKAAAKEMPQEEQGKGKVEDPTPIVSVTEPSSVDMVQEPAIPQPETEKTEEVLQEKERDVVKEIPREVQDSPISAPEPSDGPSTQASSITEEEVPLMFKPEEQEENVQLDILQVAPGLQDIIREQTQGPVVTVEEVDTGHIKDLSETPVTADLLKQHIDEHQQKQNVEQQSSNHVDPVRRKAPHSRVESDIARDSAKTTSIVSEASSVRTETGKPITPLVDTSSSPKEQPEPPSPKDSAHEVLGTLEIIDSSASTSPEQSPKIQRRALGEDPSPVDIEEPESPLPIEGHSVQTSASPSVVNLLDGLAATTHDESMMPSHMMEAAAPARAQKPSLFNMVGGFGDSEESIETPLSAVREEPEVVPQADNEVLASPPPQHKARSSLPSGSGDDTPSRGSTVETNAGNHITSAERPQSPSTDHREQAAEDSTADSPATQRTRPRTTSKTFQFPSKSRSLSRGEKPSLDLPREGTHSRQSSEISGAPVNDSRRNTILPAPKVQFAVEPETLPVSQQSPQRSLSTNSRSEKRVDTLSAGGAPVPDAISHASSKALRLLGFDANRPDSRSDIRSESTSKRNSNVQQDVSKGVEGLVRSEAPPASKVDAKAFNGDQPELLLKHQQGASSDAKSAVQPPTARKQPDMAESATPNAAKDVHEKSSTDTQAKRRGLVEPLKRVSTPEASEEQFLSDESFMEELKSAKVQEAKPVSVSRSPIRPDYLRSDTDPKFGEKGGLRMVSNPLGISTSDGFGSSASRPATAVSLRSFSGTILPRPDVKTSSPSPTAQPKKFGVSSGISQRIKALETKSSRPTSPILPAPSSPSPGFLNLRKSSFSSERSYDFRRSRNSTAYPSPQATPEMGSSEPLNQPYQQRGDTVSVTATIVRDPKDRSPRAPRKNANLPALNLHESPLTVSHQVAEPAKQQQQQQAMPPPQYSPLKPPRPRYSRYSTKSASSSSTDPKTDANATSHSRRGSVTSMRSAMSSRDGSESDLHRAMGEKSPNTHAPLDNIREEKRTSRSSRLLKRMSSVTSLSRRSIAQAISPSPKTASIMEHEEGSLFDEKEEKPFASTIDLGDVNIQFPDTLLWKRRHMTIAGGGVLTLSASLSDKVNPPYNYAAYRSMLTDLLQNPRIVTKQYPLADFRPPYIPDQDRQELPNSILLDFNDGSSLQCACEGAAGQTRILKSE